MSTRNEFVEAMKREVEDRRRTEQAQHDRAEIAEAANRLAVKRGNDLLARLQELQAGIRALIDDATRSADNCDAENAYVWITDLRALVGDETPGTGEHA